MLLRLTTLHGRPVVGSDGEVGTVARFLLDLDRWTVRYLVVGTGSWWSGHEVLLSPWAIPQLGDGDALPVSLTREQVRNSPRYDATQALTRAHETALLGHYGYPVYWVGPMLWGPVPAATRDAIPDLGTAPGGSSDAGPAATAVMESAVSGLADSRQVIGTHLGATDGEIGHADDFLVESDTWRIRYLLVDTHNWWIGRHVLIAPEWIDRLDWPDHLLHVRVDRDTIRSAPEYDPGRPLTRADEDALYRHYRQQPYWRPE